MTSIENFGWETANLARKILENWSGLEMVYKIPKRPMDMESSCGESLKKSRQDFDAETILEASQTPEKVLSFTPTSNSAHGSFSYDATESPQSYNNGRLFGAQITEEPQSTFKEMEVERDGPTLAWNHFAATPIRESPKMETSQSTPIAVTESTLEEMLEAAQRANEAKLQAAKILQQEEIDKLKKAAHLKKKKLLEHKKERRALSQSLAGKLLEKAISEDLQKHTPSKSKSKQSEHKEKSIEISQIPDEFRKKIKSNVHAF
jgi:hypothetical protein